MGSVIFRAAQAVQARWGAPGGLGVSAFQGPATAIHALPILAFGFQVSGQLSWGGFAVQ